MSGRAVSYTHLRAIDLVDAQVDQAVRSAFAPFVPEIILFDDLRAANVHPWRTAAGIDKDSVLIGYTLLGDSILVSAKAESMGSVFMMGFETMNAILVAGSLPEFISDLRDGGHQLLVNDWSDVMASWVAEKGPIPKGSSFFTVQPTTHGGQITEENLFLMPFFEGLMLIGGVGAVSYTHLPQQCIRPTGKRGWSPGPGITLPAGHRQERGGAAAAQVCRCLRRGSRGGRNLHCDRAGDQALHGGADEKVTIRGGQSFCCGVWMMYVIHFDHYDYRPLDRPDLHSG